MNVNINAIPTDILMVLKEVGARAADHAINAYLVGGSVRDVLLNTASHDYDVVLESDAIVFAKSFAKARHASVVPYPKFGTATIKMEKGLVLDFVTARREKYIKPGAMPKVTPSDMYDDLYRRDFTINAIAVSLHPDRLGEVLDYFHGVDDVGNKQLRVLHSLSFIDDPTRILRLIRYKERLGFDIEPVTLGLLHEALRQDVFKTISQGRFQKEIKLMEQERQFNAMKIQCEALGIIKVS